MPSTTAPTTQPATTLPRTGAVVPGLPQQAVLVRTTPVIGLRSALLPLRNASFNFIIFFAGDLYQIE